MTTRSQHKAYIQSEKWQLRRRDFLADHDRCSGCGINREFSRKIYDQDLHVHHKNYQRVGCELDEDLEPLCRRCHEVRTFGKSDLPPAKKCEWCDVFVTGNICDSCDALHDQLLVIAEKLAVDRRHWLIGIINIMREAFMAGTVTHWDQQNFMTLFQISMDEARYFQEKQAAA